MFRRRRSPPPPQPRTVVEALDFVVTRAGPGPDTLDAGADAEAWRRRLHEALDAPEARLAKEFIVRVFNALPPEDHPGWRHTTFNPASAIDWDGVFAGLPLGDWSRLEPHFFELTRGRYQPPADESA